MMNPIRYSVDTTCNWESLVSQQPGLRSSMLIPHELKSRPIPENQWRPAGTPDWMTALVLFCFILLAWNHVFNPKRLVQVLKAPFSRRFVNQLVREGNLFTERISFTLGIVYLLSFALFLFLIYQHFFPPWNQQENGLLLFGFLVLFLILFNALKITAINLLGNIFKTRETTYFYLLNLLVFAIITGIVLLIALVALLYTGETAVLRVSLVLVALLFLFRFLRGFLIGMTLTKFSYLLLFVYLCSLEILPLLVLVKVLVNLANSAGV